MAEIIESIKFLDAKIAEMPIEVLKKAVDFLKEYIPEEIKERIRIAYTKDPGYWWTNYHFYWGRGIRNALRIDAKLSDDLLPDKNWDDYYVPCIEIAIGVREMPEGGQDAINNLSSPKRCEGQSQT